jgi:hypothetical protein
MKRLPLSSRVAVLTCAALLALGTPAVASRTEDELRTAWVGRRVVLRAAAISNCDERYTNNRMRATQPSSGGRHRLDPGELGRVENLHLQRARIDVLITLLEPLRVEFRDGPFQLYEQLECRVELEVPAPREAVRQGAIDRLDDLLRGLLELDNDPLPAEESPIWNRRQVEPLPADHAERLADYRAWKQEQLYLALRGRLAEALDRAADIAARVDRSVPYARGLVFGAREFEPERIFSAACEELPNKRFSSSWSKAPEELEGRDERHWKDGLEDGQRLRFEIALARRLERCLP